MSNFNEIKVFSKTNLSSKYHVATFSQPLNKNVRLNEHIMEEQYSVIYHIVYS